MRWIIAFLLGFSSFASWASCSSLSNPLPTVPHGPTWVRQIDTNSFTDMSPASAELTVWRQPCVGEDNMLMATIKPIKGEPFVCSIRSFSVIQNGRWDEDVTLFLDAHDDDSDSFCDDLLKTTTFRVGQLYTKTWDPDADLVLVWNRQSQNQRLAVGAFNPADYGQTTGPKALHGSLSGSWYDPSRDGEGFALEFGEAGGSPIGTLYWFTYKNGKAYWLAGASNYRTGQSKITFDLIEFRGTGFGAQFKPNNVLHQEVGTINLEFDSCQSGRATWRMDNGETGSFNLRRITTGIHGVPCQ